MGKGAVLILGAGSDIGMAVADAFAQRGHAIQLAARTPQALEAVRAELATRHSVSVTTHSFDALATAGHGDFITDLPELPETAVCAVGFMGEQSASEQDLEAAALVMRSNFEGPANILGALANRFEARGSGTIVGISSVAGARGRATNYAYGAAKAGFTAFLSGLRNRLAKKGVHVVTVLPGFVNTQMTKGMDLPAKLTAEPDEVAEAIVKAVTTGKDVIYVRPIWRLIMAVIRNIPERIFKKMKL